jgi:biotin carboxyl carrier protein
MKLLVTVDGKAGELQFKRDGSMYQLNLRLDGVENVSGAASLLEVEPGIFSVLVGGRSYEAKVVPAANGYHVDLRGHRSTIEVRDPRTLVRRGKAGVGEGRQSITAPMPGKIIRVLVREGDEVEAGAGVVVVEAMKMQNEMKAPKAGRVLQLTAREGDTVSAGDVLGVVE